MTEFCAGAGRYAKLYNENAMVVNPYDGTLTIHEKTHGFVIHKDMSIYDPLKKTDIVQCFECGEHIPEPYFHSFLSNIIESADHMIIMSWGVIGQPGFNHVNNIKQTDLVNILANYGWFICEKDSQDLRTSSTFHWFKNTILVFYSTKRSKCQSSSFKLIDDISEFSK